MFGKTISGLVLGFWRENDCGAGRTGILVLFRCEGLGVPLDGRDMVCFLDVFCADVSIGSGLVCRGFQVGWCDTISLG
jgi:hypothetical protein